MRAQRQRRCLLRSSVQNSIEGWRKSGSSEASIWTDCVNDYDSRRTAERQRGCERTTMTTTMTRLEELNGGWNRFVVAARCHSPTNTYGSTPTHLLPQGAVRRPLPSVRPSCYGQPLHRVTQTRWVFKARSATYDGGATPRAATSEHTSPLIIRRNTISVRRRHCKHRYRSCGDDDDSDDDFYSAVCFPARYPRELPTSCQFQGRH